MNAPSPAGVVADDAALRATRGPAPGRPQERGRAGRVRRPVVVFAVLNPGTFLTAKNIQTILNQAALPLIIAVGATLVILMGSIDLSVEGVMGAAGMTFVLMTANSRGSHDYGVVTALIVALAVGMVLGLVSGLIHTRLKVPSFIVTLGRLVRRPRHRHAAVRDRADPVPRRRPLKAWPSSLTLGLPNSFWLAVLVVALGAASARYTRWAGSTYAIGNNEQIALSNGVPVARNKVIIFALAGACSALAGRAREHPARGGVGDRGHRQPVPDHRGGGHRRHLPGRRQGRHPAQRARGRAAHHPEQRPDPLGREPEHTCRESPGRSWWRRSSRRRGRTAAGCG